jgi:hypothetical protein
MSRVSTGSWLATGSTTDKYALSIILALPIELLVIIIIAGALFGGSTLGGVVRKGCAFVILGGLLFVAILVGVFLYYSRAPH